MKHVYLRQVLEWRKEIDHGWSVPARSLGKCLKKRLPADIWAQVEETYVGAGLELKFCKGQRKAKWALISERARPWRFCWTT